MGNFSGLSAGCRIITGSDDYSGPFLSNPTVPDKFKRVSQTDVRIGRHAIIGTGTTIFPGVEIGDGVAVAAGSIVRKNLEPWNIYAEINGKLKVIGKRPKEQILRLEAEYLGSLGMAKKKSTQKNV